jgi:hypothetical protein
MLRAADSRLVFLAEGDSDCSALETLVDQDATNLIPGHGKKNVKGAIDLADKHDLKRVVALLDRDWLDLLEERSTSPNTFYTDDYDIDATIFFAGTVANRVAANFSERSKLSAFLAKVDCADIRQWCLKVTLPIGVLRYISQRDNLQLALTGFPVDDVLLDDFSSVDLGKLVHIAYARSKHRPGPEETDILGLLRIEIATLEGDARAYCSGHDIARALSAALRKKCGGSDGAQSIANAIRAALGRGDWKHTQLFAAVRVWAQQLGVLVWCFD